MGERVSKWGPDGETKCLRKGQRSQTVCCVSLLAIKGIQATRVEPSCVKTSVMEYFGKHSGHTGTRCNSVINIRNSTSWNESCNTQQLFYGELAVWVKVQESERVLFKYLLCVSQRRLLNWQGTMIQEVGGWTRIAQDFGCKHELRARKNTQGVGAHSVQNKMWWFLFIYLFKRPIGQ